MTILNKTSAREPIDDQVTQGSKKFVYTDGTAQVTMNFSIPGGSVLNKAASGAYVQQVFDAGTTNTLDIGNSSDAAAYASALALTAKDFVPLDEGGALYIANDTEIFVRLNLTGTAATQGEVYVSLHWDRVSNP